MLGFPASTEFGKRIPKQKFYENLDVPLLCAVCLSIRSGWSTGETSWQRLR